MKKGYGPEHLAILAIVFVVGAVTISIGATVGDSMRSAMCTQGGATWGDYPTSAANYPVTSSKTGCCTTINATNACTTWATLTTMNISTSGLQGINTFGTWLPTIAIVLMAAIVIGILLYSFKFGKGSA